MERKEDQDDCDGLNEQCPPQIRYVNTWSLVDGSVWEDYGTCRRCSLDGGSMPWGLALRVRSLASLPVCFLSFLGVDGNMIFQLPVPVACCHTVCATMDCLSGTLGAIGHFFRKLLF